MSQLGDEPEERMRPRAPLPTPDTGYHTELAPQREVERRYPVILGRVEGGLPCRVSVYGLAPLAILRLLASLFQGGIRQSLLVLADLIERLFV